MVKKSIRIKKRARLFSEKSSRLEQLSVGVGGGQGVLTGDLNDFSTATRFSTSNYFFHFLYLNLSRTSIAPPRETAVVLACFGKLQTIAGNHYLLHQFLEIREKMVQKFINF